MGQNVFLGCSNLQVIHAPEYTKMDKIRKGLGIASNATIVYTSDDIKSAQSAVNLRGHGKLKLHF